MKLMIFTILFQTLLFAKEVSQSEQNSVMIEAILFVGIFGTMGILSYIYSNKHAKAYKKKDVEIESPKQERIEVDRITELSKMLENGSLTQEEFELLQNHHLQS